MPETLTKAEVARQLPAMKQQVESLARQFNRTDAILILLCLQDAFDNLMNGIVRGMVTRTGPSEADNELLQTALYRHADRYFDLIDQELIILFNSSRLSPRSLSELPSIWVGIGLGSPDEMLAASIVQRARAALVL